MSWQEYVDSNLVGTGNVKKALIMGHDGSAWAATAGFSISATEAKKIINAFKDSSEVLASGIHIQGDKYMAIKSDDRSVYGKKGASGCINVKTNQAVLVALYDETIQPGQAANTVERLADYLIDNGM